MSIDLHACPLCGGVFERRRVTAENWWGEELSLVEDVPAWVCDRCGHVFYDPEVVERLDAMRRSPPPAHKTMAVPVYSFEEQPVGAS